jgi:histidinol dehydrogenase
MISALRDVWIPPSQQVAEKILAISKKDKLRFAYTGSKAVHLALRVAIIAENQDELFNSLTTMHPSIFNLAAVYPLKVLAKIKHAAEVLIGQSTPFALASFMAVVHNTLPTGQFNKISSGV